MRCSRPINWRMIRDKHAGNWARMKGEFGEVFVREFLERRGLSPERLQRRARGLPDFKLTGLPVCVEVKSHRSRIPVIWQRKGFISMRRLGWRILIAHPRIFRSWDGEQVICTGIDWYHFDEQGCLRMLDGFPEELPWN